SGAKTSVAAGRSISHEIEAPDPAHRPQRDVHRTRPVDAVGVRVGGDPVARFGDEFLRVPILAGDPEGLTETREVLAAAQLPGNLDVSRPIELVVRDVAAILQRPRSVGLEVRMPRQRRAKPPRTRSEQIEFM